MAICAAIVLMSASITSQLMTIKPALPKVVKNKIFTGYPREVSNSMGKYISQCTSQGYIIKHVVLNTINASGAYSIGVVVAEKY